MKPRATALRSPSRAVLWGGIVVSVLLAAVVVWLAWFTRERMLEDERARAELLARVIEDQATRSVEASAIALASLAEVLVTQPAGAAPDQDALLRPALVGLPFLRGVAIVDRDGRVRGSTHSGDAGRRVDLERLGPWPEPGQDRLGRYAAGRGLGALAVGAPAEAAPAGVGFIPMLRGVRLRTGETLALVALINPDALSNLQALAIGDGPTSALLVGFEGELLSASPNVVLQPGARLTSHPVFTRYLPTREHASFVGPGSSGAQDVVAFRVSRSRPLVALVEHPRADVDQRAWLRLRAFIAVALAAELVLLTMTLIAARSLRARENTRRQLDAAQAEVAQRERELSVTVRSVQELIFRTDAKGSITFANDRWLAIAGSTSSGAMGRRLKDMVLPAHRDAVAALFDPAAGAGVRVAHATIEHPSGPRHFDIAVVPLMHRGATVGYAGSAADVTDRVVAQQRLQTQLEVSALMLQVSPLPLSMLDTQGRYLNVNQAWEDFTGRRREAVIGTRAGSHVAPEETAEHDAHDRELLARGGRHRYEARVMHRDGSPRDVVLDKVVVPGDDGRPAGILCVLMDVSEFRAAERATREARDAAEETSRAKTEFIANISHELRTPLQSILGFSELGLVRGRAHEKLAAMFADIHASGQRMLALVNDLLDVAKIESTVGTFHLERMDLRPLMREAARELEPLLTPRRLTLELHLPELPLLAKVDPLRLQQVLRNVMANAIKFSPEAGRIELEGRTTASGEIHLVVRDQGPGIPPQEIEHVFEAFVQSSQTKDGSGGTGLGLAICRKIVQAHGGRIHAENLPGGGAAFHIRLPARGQTETAPMPLDAP